MKKNVIKNCFELQDRLDFLKKQTQPYLEMKRLGAKWMCV